MRSLQISDNDLAGRRFNGHDLHLNLLQRGFEADQLVWKKRSNDSHTFEIGRHYADRERINSLVSGWENDLLTHGTLYPFSHSLLFDSKFLEADIVHYHLIHNFFFNINHLPILTAIKPSVWTLHDPWAITGHCVHFFSCQRWKSGCGDCPNLETEFALRKDSTALSWEIKRLAYQASKIDLIVSSKWMYEIVRESPLTKHFEVHLIPFGIDREVFRPQTKPEAKQLLKIPRENKVIAFRASSWKLKGLRFLIEALERLDQSDKVTLLTSNEIGLINGLKKKFHTVELGWIDDVETLTSFYSAADIFVMPSEAESFGMSAIESMACGTPVIAFDDTVLVDTIGIPRGGIAVPKGSSEALCMAIQSVLFDHDMRNRLANGALEIVQEKYDLKRYFNNIVDLYQYVVDKRGQDDRSIYLLQQLKQISNKELEIGSEQIVYKADLARLSIKEKISNKLRRYPILHQLIRTVYRRIRGKK